MTYIWQKRDWPAFTWDPEVAYQNSHEFAREVECLGDYVRQLSKTEQQHAMVELMVSEAMQTSWIEGEKLAYEDVRAAICNDLGLSPKKETVRDPKARGVVAMLVSARKHFSEPLTSERLCEWQDRLIVGRYDRAKLATGAWRSSPKPMQIVSGAYGKEVVHYEAPPAAQVPAEIVRFNSNASILLMTAMVVSAGPWLRLPSHRISAVRRCLASRRRSPTNVEPITTGSRWPARAVSTLPGG